MENESQAHSKEGTVQAESEVLNSRLSRKRDFYKYLPLSACSEHFSPSKEGDIDSHIARFPPNFGLFLNSLPVGRISSSENAMILSEAMDELLPAPEDLCMQAAKKEPLNKISKRILGDGGGEFMAGLEGTYLAMLASEVIESSGVLIDEDNRRQLALAGLLANPALLSDILHEPPEIFQDICTVIKELPSDHPLISEEESSKLYKIIQGNLEIVNQNQIKPINVDLYHALKSGQTDLPSPDTINTDFPALYVLTRLLSFSKDARGVVDLIGTAFSKDKDHSSSESVS